MTTRLRKVIFFILLMGVAYVAYQFMIKPANKNLAQARARVNAKSEKLREFDKAAPTTADINQKLEKLQEAINFFESQLPPKSEIDKVLEQVTVIAQKQGLKPKTIRALDKKTNNAGYIEQPLQMELEGNFNAFYSFLLELEKLPRIMKIRELDITKQTNDSVTAKFIVSVFFLG